MYLLHKKYVVMMTIVGKTYNVSNEYNTSQERNDRHNFILFKTNVQHTPNHRLKCLPVWNFEEGRLR